MRHRVVAFVGKQDPHRNDGTPGPVLSAAALLPVPVTEALLLFAEGASDRADRRDESLSAGTQELRAQELGAQLGGQWPGLRTELASLAADPSDARAVLRALRDHPGVQAARTDSAGVQTHLLVAGGTPAMREVLSSLQVTEFFGDTRGWYQPDRGGTLREEVPVVAEAALLSSLRTAMQVGEFRAAGLLLGDLGHAGTDQAGMLLTVLALEQQGEVAEALRGLRRWKAPDLLAAWQREAGPALALHGQPGGMLMHLWNATQVQSPRTALLAYATLMEQALRVLCELRRVRVDRNAAAETMTNALLVAGQDLPDALNAAAGTPRRLYGLRNGAIHQGHSVSPEELPVVHTAATDLLRTFPAPDEELRAFLTRPQRNPFAPQRHAELAQTVFRWLNG